MRGPLDPTDYANGDAKKEFCVCVGAVNQPGVLGRGKPRKIQKNNVNYWNKLGNVELLGALLQLSSMSLPSHRQLK